MKTKSGETFKVIKINTDNTWVVLDEEFDVLYYAWRFLKNNHFCGMCRENKGFISSTLCSLNYAVIEKNNIEKCKNILDILYYNRKF